MTRVTVLRQTAHDRVAHHAEGIVDHVRAAFLARPTIERVMHAHFADVRDRAEARASRSRVFAPDATAR